MTLVRYVVVLDEIARPPVTVEYGPFPACKAPAGCLACRPRYEFESGDLLAYVSLGILTVAEARKLSELYKPVPAI